MTTTTEYLNLGGKNIGSVRDSVKYAYTQVSSEPELSLTGATYAYSGAATMRSVTADIVGLVLGDNDALEAVVASPGPIPYRHGTTYLAVERNSLSASGPEPIYSVEWLVKNDIRLVDFWGYGATLEAATVWTNSPSVAYYQQNSGSQSILSSSGLVFTGSSTWNTSLREKEDRAVLDLVTLEAYCSVPLTSEAAIGIMDLSASWATRPLGGNGTGIHFQNATLSVTTGADVLSLTMARSGGDYRVQIQDRGLYTRILIWENGVLLLRTSRILSGATTSLRGAVFSIKSGTATLQRWWVGGF